MIRMPDIHIHIHGDTATTTKKSRKAVSSRSKASGGGKDPKPKRKASAYSKRYGKAYKRLKKKHPRMSMGSLSKKAHTAARKK